MVHNQKIWKSVGLQPNSMFKAFGCVEKKVSILHKRKPCKVNIGPYDPVVLKLIKCNMNLCT